MAPPDPERVEKLRRQFLEFKSVVAGSIADEKRLEKQLQSREQKEQDWLAGHATGAGDGERR